MNIDVQRVTYLTLDPVVGWQAQSSGLATGAAGALSVECVPGQPAKFAESAAGKLRYPIALACDWQRKNICLLDEPVERVRLIGLDSPNEMATLAGIGGRGNSPRQFRHARGFDFLVDGSVVVADTSNHQVKIFTAFPHALASSWGTGKPGDGPHEFHSPWKVAVDRCGLIYIADRGNNRVQRLERNGRRHKAIGGLQDPTGLTLHSDGTLAVLVGNAVQIFAPGGLKASASLSVPDASCLTFDGEGFLYVGTSTALIYKFAPSTFEEVGIGASGLDAEFLDLQWTRQNQLIGLLLMRCTNKPVLRSFCTCGTYIQSGTLMTETLDSGIENCVWHRVELEADVPPGTLISVATQTAEEDIWSALPSPSFQPDCSSAAGMMPNCAIPLTGNNPDSLVQSKAGRYLRLQLQLKTNRVATPKLKRIRLHYPRQSYLQYLPSIYQEDDDSRIFLERFLSIFQTSFDKLDRTIDDMWMMFDPVSVKDNWFPWLAGWLALPVNPKWSDPQRRATLKAAGTIYPQRGTPAGVQQLIKQYSGVDARLVEHFRLRQLLILRDKPDDQAAIPGAGRLWSRDYYQRLQLGVYSRVGYFRLTGEPEPGIEPLAWGANEFSVFFNCEPYEVADTLQSVVQVVEREKPAYTKANYSPVLPRMRVGVQSTLGVDTRIGEITPLLLGTTGKLGYDAILACKTSDLQLPWQPTAPITQVNISSRLL